MKNLIDQKIFLVDDDELSRAYYVQHLKNLGYTNLFEFQNGSECINHLIDSPDIIFLDQNMANMNGLDVLKKIKRINPNIYVVFLSGQSEIVTAVDALKYGAFDYIIKNDDTLKSIEKVLTKIGSLKTLIAESKGFRKRLFPFLF